MRLIEVYENTVHNQRKNHETPMARWYIYPWKLLEIPFLQDGLYNLHLL